jgi:hypothetical protein
MPDQLLHVGAPPLKSKYFVLSRILTDKLFGLRDDPPFPHGACTDVYSTRMQASR